jgi:hypothetical protein
VDPQAIELVELGVGRQLGIEDQLLRISPRPVLPEPSETEDLVVLFALAERAVGVAEDTGRGILYEESQDAFLPSAPLGDIIGMFWNSEFFVSGP